MDCLAAIGTPLAGILPLLVKRLSNFYCLRRIYSWIWSALNSILFLDVTVSRSFCSIFLIWLCSVVGAGKDKTGWGCTDARLIDIGSRDDSILFLFLTFLVVDGGSYSAIVLLFYSEGLLEPNYLDLTSDFVFFSWDWVNLTILLEIGISLAD